MFLDFNYYAIIKIHINVEINIPISDTHISMRDTHISK